MAKDSIARALAINALKKSDISFKGTVATIGNLPSTGNRNGDEYWVTDQSAYYSWNGNEWTNVGGHVNLDNYLAKDNSTVYSPTGQYNPATLQTVENYIGRMTQLDFDATLEGNIITGVLSQDLSDYDLINNAHYTINLVLPIVLLTDELNDNYSIILKDKNDNTININCIYQKDISISSTVGDLCQIQNYNVETGYSWNFSVYYKEITEDGTLYRVMYTQDPVREQNTSMTGVKLYNSIVAVNLKPGTSVYITEDYVANGFVFREGHTYKITGDWTGGELNILASDVSGLETVVRLLDITNIAPTPTIEGQRYYNSDNNRIYTSNTGMNWGAEEEPINGIIYFNLDDNEQYIYNGTSLISMSNNTPANKVLDTLAGENKNQHEINEYLYAHGLPISDFTIYGNQSTSLISGAGKYLFIGSVTTMNITATSNVEIVILGTLGTLTLPETIKTVLLHANGYTGESLTSENTGALADGSRVGNYNIRCTDIA